MNKNEVLEKIGQKKLVPIIRTATAEDAGWAVNVLADAGISVFEITLTIPNAVDLISELSSVKPDLLIGAGTVLVLTKPGQALTPAQISSSAQYLNPAWLNFVMTTRFA
jgi:2-keto-3-deoxy-6-phosphogluconate aldolase